MPPKPPLNPDGSIPDRWQMVEKSGPTMRRYLNSVIWVNDDLTPADMSKYVGFDDPDEKP